jgi:hypothetical protein
VLLLADLAEATGGGALQTSGQEEVLNVLTPEQLTATREKIAAKFERQSSGLTPIARLLTWSISDPRRRTISPFSKLTVPEWVENRIKADTLDDLRAAIFVNPVNARLAAHFSWRLGNYALQKETNPDDTRRARAEADF